MPKARSYLTCMTTSGSLLKHFSSSNSKSVKTYFGQIHSSPFDSNSIVSTTPRSPPSSATPFLASLLFELLIPAMCYLPYNICHNCHSHILVQSPQHCKSPKHCQPIQVSVQGPLECQQCLSTKPQRETFERKCQEVKEGLKEKIGDLKRREKEITDSMAAYSTIDLACLTPLPGDRTEQPAYIQDVWRER